MLDPQAYPEVHTNLVDPRSARPSPAALPYPGARWWSFYLHAHKPASADTPHWQQANGTDQEVTPERWLIQFMAAGIDCVAITDHNSGDWIDPLQAAYRRMEQEAGAIPIPAHADRSAPSGKALFAIREGSQASFVDTTTLKQLFESAHLLLLPPALIGEQHPLITAVQQRPRLTPQRLDQMPQIDAPRPSMALLSPVEPHQFAAELPAQ